MTSFRQIEANRRNALRSTGPKTEEGKRQSRRNALRHGLTAETVIGGLEDSEDYRAFEAAVIADYEAETAVERELVLRLASLLWRLRRIISIETDLFNIQSDIIRESRAAIGDEPVDPEGDRDLKTRSPHFIFDSKRDEGSDNENDISRFSALLMPVRDLTCCFLRLSNADNGAFERLGRYNALLWRHTAQTLFLLHSFRRRTAGPRCSQLW
jgi:hypothetical protein